MTRPRATFTLTLRSAIDAIGPATARTEAWLGEHHVSGEATYLVSLAIEELVTNCIKYGYDDGGTHRIEIALVIEDGALRMDVIDDGREFNPLEAPAPDLSLPLEQRRIGGLGLHLLRELADDLTYERRDGSNRLSITKKL